MASVTATSTCRHIFAIRSPGGPATPRWFWTLIGASAIPLWATWPTMAVSLSAFPVFQLLFMMFGVGGLALLAIERKARKSARTRWLPVFACAVGLLGADMFFLAALKFIPAAQANILSFLWPVMICMFGAMLGLVQLNWRHRAGLAMGFAGAAFALGADDMVFSWPGIGIALLSGASWALFCLYRLQQGPRAENALAFGCLTSAAICFIVHLLFEKFIAPTRMELIAIVAMGVVVLAMATLAWDTGMRRGDSRRLAIAAYATPLISAGLLIAFGFASLTANLVIGAALVVGAGIVSAEIRCAR